MKCLFIQSLVLIFLLLGAQEIIAVPISIPSPSGSITIDISYAGPSGQWVEPDPPVDAGFRPPTIFAAPLPTGSGARALGQSGAFTAVADDATAASWNPAGLVQLEVPEASAVYRFSTRSDQHRSRTSALEAGEDRYNCSEINYLSVVYPFLLNECNAVFSFNYQEAYDFTQEFTAHFSGANQDNVNSTLNEVFSKSQTNYFSDVYQSLTLISTVTTDAKSEITQVLNSSLLSGVDFYQKGTIDAISPSFAVELNPKLSLGVTLNMYTDGDSRGNEIESLLVADYSGTSSSLAGITDTRDSVAMISWSGERYGGDPLDPVTVPVSSSVQTNFSSVENSVQEDLYTVEGTYTAYNATKDFYGVNATLGMLWSVNDALILGASVDLPWTGYGCQIKETSHQVSTFDSNLDPVASTNHQESLSHDVRYTFPLCGAVGALWRCHDHLFTSMDVSCTCWSQFSYKADGEERINPLNGEPYASSALDDCWAVRWGGEYLWILSWTEIPFRAGAYYEQRPAINRPDEYWGLSFGTGISLGSGANKGVLDVAYLYEQGNNVMGALLPGQAVYSDVVKHQVFISAIWHF